MKVDSGSFSMNGLELQRFYLRWCRASIFRSGVSAPGADYSGLISQMSASCSARTNTICRPSRDTSELPVVGLRLDHPMERELVAERPLAGDVQEDGARPSSSE